MKLIKLTFFHYDSVHPQRSKSTDKKFLQNIDAIAQIIPYHAHAKPFSGQTSKGSTKIRLVDGSEFEVCESLHTILTEMEKYK